MLARCSFLQKKRLAEKSPSISLPNGTRDAVPYALSQTARLNDVDEQAWLAGEVARIAVHPLRQLDQLLPWNWQHLQAALAE